MNKSLLGFIIAVVFFGLAFWVYDFFLKKNEYFLMDNPTSESVSVRWNEQKITLPAYQFVNVNFKNGRNRLQVLFKDSIIVDTLISIQNPKRFLLNPTRSEYIIFTQYYGYVPNKDSLLKSHQTKVDEKLYFGEIIKTKSLFIKDFYYNINEDFDKIIRNIDSIERRKKIFRKEQFKNYYRETYNY